MIEMKLIKQAFLTRLILASFVTTKAKLHLFINWEKRHYLLLKFTTLSKIIKTMVFDKESEKKLFKQVIEVAETGPTPTL